MKRIILVIFVFISVLILSGCSENPFKAPSGTEFIESDVLSYDYYNGSYSSNVFEYTFSKEYLYFIDTEESNYRFTAINNYQEISDEFISFLDLYEDDTYSDRYLNESGNGALELSLGATEDDYNLVKVTADSEIYDVDAFIVVENGIRIIFSYTEFFEDGNKIVIPFNFAIIASEIHEAYSKEYLPINNEYVDEKAILTRYRTAIIPFPPKVGFWPTTFGEEEEIKDMGRFMRIIEDTSNVEPHTEELCSIDVIDNCFTPEYSSINGFVYELSLAEVIQFYEENHGGRYDGDNFIFFMDTKSYKISLAESTINIDYSDTDSQTEDVVTFEITKYFE